MHENKDVVNKRMKEITSNNLLKEFDTRFALYMEELERKIQNI